MPQLSEYVVFSLLRQCFRTPKCHAYAYRQLRAISLRSPKHHQHHRISRLEGVRRSYDINNDYADLKYFHGSSRKSQNTQPFSPANDFHEHHEDQRQLNNSKFNIAVIGGGITGLASAHYITRLLPGVKVTIYEGSNRLGGWLRSEYVDIGGEKVLFEKGPRTLRPNTTNAVVMYDMICALGLEDQIVTTPKTSVSARNRFVYYPNELVKMPGPGQDIFDMLWRMFTQPVFGGFWRVILESLQPQRSKSLEDESVASFLERRLGDTRVADNIVSAVFHGIYAGDITKLSAKSLMPYPWTLEALYGSMIGPAVKISAKRIKLLKASDLDLLRRMAPEKASLNKNLAGVSVFSFKNGIEQLTETLIESLQKNSNVQFKMNGMISALDYDRQTRNIKIKPAGKNPISYTHVISTISGAKTAALTSGQLQDLTATPSVTVMLVNLYYNDPNLLPERGFGYLIPRSIPYEQNPECALGVVFDSDAIQDQDTATGTKLTVMMGGHWWDGLDMYPTEEEGVGMAKAVLLRHLSVTDEPAYAKATLARDCIPQYTVGHSARMKKANADLERGFQGKLAVAGSSYTGVGVNDCVRGARDVVMSILSTGKATGLENFAEDDESSWAIVTPQPGGRQITRGSFRIINQK